MAVRQTSCRHCGLDIEGFSPYRKGEWRDRGNNTHCPTKHVDTENGRVLIDQVHAPLRDMSGLALPTRTTRLSR